jgi:hypothetical protein
MMVRMAHDSMLEAHALNPSMHELERALKQNRTVTSYKISLSCTTTIEYGYDARYH